MAVLVDEGVHGAAVGREGDRGRPQVPLRSQRPAGSRGPLDQPQLLVGSLLGGGAALADADQLRTVVAQHPGGELVRLVRSGQHLQSAVGHRHRRHRAHRLAAAPRLLPVDHGDLAGRVQADVGADPTAGVGQQVAEVGRRRGQVGPARRLQVHRQQPGLLLAEVMVPEPDRIALVQHRGHLALLAERPLVGIGPVVGRTGEAADAQHGAARGPGGGDARPAPDPAGHDVGLAAGGGQAPERGGVLLVLGRCRLLVCRGGGGERPFGAEQQAAVAQEGRGRLALRRPGHPSGGSRPGRVQLPPGRGVGRALRVQRGDRDEQPAVRTGHQRTQPRQGREGREVQPG